MEGNTLIVDKYKILSMSSLNEIFLNIKKTVPLYLKKSPG